MGTEREQWGDGIASDNGWDKDSDVTRGRKKLRRKRMKLREVVRGKRRIIFEEEKQGKRYRADKDLLFTCKFHDCNYYPFFCICGIDSVEYDSNN